MKSILITGGAGFVGSSLAIDFKKTYPQTNVICLDNLSRRGSELNLPRLAHHDIKFVHGDVRNSEDLNKIGKVDWLIECSAEPSVHAGYNESPAYLINTNLLGLINCLEYLRQFGGQLVFLSTSRVYPIDPLRKLPLQAEGNRFVLKQPFSQLGTSNQGISELFSLEGHRSLYGATKLCGELLIQEYQKMYGLKAIINRCGVLAGPWQMGKVDQGFMALWVARHFFGGALKYMGFEGKGLQVRDVLHVRDLFNLLQIQMNEDSAFETIFNVGGGLKNSISLFELTEMTQSIVGKKPEIGQDPITREADLPFYVTDNKKVMDKLGWSAEISVMQIVEEIALWLKENQATLKPLFQ